MSVNVTNGELLAAMFGSRNSDDWIGKKVVLYRDPNVFFGGKPVGGIRCRAPQTEQVPIEQPTTEPKVTDDDIPY